MATTYPHISFCLEELDKHENVNKNEEEINHTFSFDEWILPVNQVLSDHEYEQAYTVKELMLICEYYGFAKEMKSNKLNKAQIIDYLVAYESNVDYAEIVSKRRTMWFYLHELRKDKFMKKFVLW